jgi:Domain of unknown function (DUF4864)
MVVSENGPMKSVFRSILLSAIALTSLASSAAGPATVSSSDARAIRAVIEAQLDAMAADDAALAFSYASPSIRMQFDDASSFMTMVRQGYPMLIRPTETLFYQPRTADEGVLQIVHLRDQDGEVWVATYFLQRQPDKSWRINGCVVQPDEDDNSLT